MSRVDAHDGPAIARSRAHGLVGGGLALALIGVLGSASAFANPIPESAAREMAARPARWLAQRDSSDARGLVFQFSQYGVSRHLLTAATIDLLEREFDRFVPLLVESQTPPHVVNAELQRWFWARADEDEGAAMRRALRAWLTAPMTEAPVMASSQITGPPEAVAEAILEARRRAAEALGDVRDAEALPALRALLAGLPIGDPVVESAIRRITHPRRPEVLGFDQSHRVSLGRSAGEIDSARVTWRRRDREIAGSTRLDASGSRRAWAALGRATEYRPQQVASGAADEDGPYWPVDVTFHLRGGDRFTIELDAGYGFGYREAGRPGFEARLRAPELLSALVAERERLGVEAEPPHFVEESVTLWIEPGELTVRGRYRFEGTPPDGVLRLRYPIAHGSGLGPPTVDSMTLLSGGVATPLTFEQSGHEARVALAPGQVPSYELIVHYRQALTARQARYLVTTARDWGLPLRRATFRVILPRSPDAPRFSLPFHEVSTEGPREFVFDASPFEPARDIDVAW